MDASGSSPSDGRKRRWEQHNSDRRNAVLAAALTVLARVTEPGEDVKVQQIADEARIHRTVVYRYFQDRADLDLAIQREICRRLRETMIDSVTRPGPPRDRIRWAVEAPARWVMEHPTWMRFAERDLIAVAVSPLDEVIGNLTGHIETVVDEYMAVAGTELSNAERRLVAPWIFGVITGYLSSVRNWSARGGTTDTLDDFTQFLADTIWLQIKGLAFSRGIRLPYPRLPDPRFPELRPDAGG